MGYDIGAAAADVLRHRNGRVFYLIDSRQAAQLQRRLDDLIDARRADRMPARLQAAHGADGQFAVQPNVAIETEANALSRFGKATGFEARDRRDRERIMHFK